MPSRHARAGDSPPAFRIDRSVAPIVLPITPGAAPPDNASDDGVRFCPHCNPCQYNGNEKCRATR